jgi:hypothetical protein
MAVTNLIMKAEKDTVARAQFYLESKLSFVHENPDGN